MAENVKALPTAEIELTQSEREAIEKATGWVSESLAELGATYLEFKRAEESFLAARERLEAGSREATQAQRQHDNVLAGVAKIRGLPPGTWMYNPEKGSLSKKVTSE